jgi:hypothetical protein
MIDHLTGGTNKMLARAAHIEHGGDKENYQAEDEKVKGNSSGHCRLPETAIRFEMFRGLHLGFP